MNYSPKFLIETLGLKKHPEGGYYKEIYKSDDYISQDDLPDEYSGKRALSTAIYFM